MKQENIEARVHRLLDQLEKPETSAQEIELIKAKVAFLESLRE